MLRKPIGTLPRRLLAGRINPKGGSCTAASSFSFDRQIQNRPASLFDEETCENPESYSRNDSAFCYRVGIGAVTGLLPAPKSCEGLQGNLADGDSDRFNQVRPTGKHLRRRAQKVIGSGKRLGAGWPSILENEYFEMSAGG